MKLWTIFQGKIFLLNEWRGFALFCVDLFSLLSSCLLTGGWMDEDDGSIRVCDRIFCIYTNQFHGRSQSAYLFTFLSNGERWKSQCDLPTHNLNGIRWCEKMVIPCTVMWLDVLHGYFLYTLLFSFCQLTLSSHGLHLWLSRLTAEIPFLQ